MFLEIEPGRRFYVREEVLNFIYISNLGELNIDLIIVRQQLVILRVFSQSVYAGSVLGVFVTFL